MRPSERSDPTQHAKGRRGDCPGPRTETATRRNVTQGVSGRQNVRFMIYEMGCPTTNSSIEGAEFFLGGGEQRWKKQLFSGQKWLETFPLNTRYADFSGPPRCADSKLPSPLADKLQVLVPPRRCVGSGLEVLQIVNHKGQAGFQLEGGGSIEPPG